MSHALPHKPAATEHDILSSIQNRWSPVIFDPKPVEEEKIQRMFEAARWAPSSYNEQPWRYIYAQKDDGEEREKLENLLHEGNAWAKNAGLLIIVWTCTTFSKNNTPNYNAEYDVGCATGYLFLQLESLGLIGHEMVGFSLDTANDVLGVPSDYKPMAMIAVGYPGNVDAADEAQRERDAAARERKSIDAFAYSGNWKNEE